MYIIILYLPLDTELNMGLKEINIGYSRTYGNIYTFFHSWATAKALIQIKFKVYFYYITTVHFKCNLVYI